MPEQSALIAVIGGSGFYDIEGLGAREVWEPETPFGRPSGPVVIGTLHDRRIAFIPRHGVGHELLPQEIPVRANLWALKTLGVQGIIAVSAVGSLQESIAPLHLVIPDQIIDRTHSQRPGSFFGGGIAAHVGFADPFCPDLSARLESAAHAMGATVHRGGPYVCIEGPLFSTRAESAIYRSWGAAVIGMTAIPEAKLAREAEIAYAMLAAVSDYDVWHAGAPDVSAELIVGNVRRNAEAAQRIVAAVVRDLPADWTSTAAGALANAIITAPERIPARVKRDLAPIIGAYLP